MRRRASRPLPSARWSPRTSPSTAPTCASRARRAAYPPHPPALRSPAIRGARRQPPIPPGAPCPCPCPCTCPCPCPCAPNHPLPPSRCPVCTYYSLHSPHTPGPPRRLPHLHLPALPLLLRVRALPLADAPGGGAGQAVHPRQHARRRLPHREAAGGDRRPTHYSLLTTHLNPNPSPNPDPNPNPNPNPNPKPNPYPDPNPNQAMAALTLSTSHMRVEAVPHSRAKVAPRRLTPPLTPTLALALAPAPTTSPDPKPKPKPSPKPSP